MSYDSRVAAFQFVLDAEKHNPRHESIEEFVKKAEQVNHFLLKDDLTLVIILGPVRDQATHSVVAHPLERKNGMTALKDNQQVDFTVATSDAKGFATVGDTITATSADESVATVSLTGNTGLIVAGAPGSTVITVTDGTLTGTLAIDVTTGDTASIVVTPGTVVDQPAAPPAPEPTPAPVTP